MQFLPIFLVVKTAQTQALHKNNVTFSLNKLFFIFLLLTNRYYYNTYGSRTKSTPF